MSFKNQNHISNFFVAGISYKKTDAALRGEFAITNEQYEQIFQIAPQYNISEFFIISTCNRTEIYGFAESPENLCALLCTKTAGSIEKFKEISYINKGLKAIQHLFEVAAGLDSQILGDYEILGQMKTAIKISKQNQFIGAYLERLTNSVFQSSKLIKTNTELSSGTVSVAFAAIQYLKENVANFNNKKIVLIGTGKIGKSTCKNIVDYLGTRNITLINRTNQKAEDLANELGLKYADIKNLPEQISAADIVIVATNHTEPVVLLSHLEKNSNKIIIDLSIPFNVEKSVSCLEGIRLINVDDLSKIKDATISKRMAEVPKAKSIIQSQVNDYLDWHEMRKNAPILKAIKNKLNDLQSCDFFNNYFVKEELENVKNFDKDYAIQKVINGLAVKMRTNNEYGCDYIGAINEFINAS